VDAFVAEQTARQKDLLAQSEAQLGRSMPPERVMNDFRVFEFIDTLSVWIAENMRVGRDVVYVPDHAGKRVTVTIQRAGDWEFRLAPFPFQGDRLECPIVARLLSQHVYENWHEFHEAWYASKLVVLPYACVS
jgi:hypothetical protein